MQHLEKEILEEDKRLSAENSKGARSVALQQTWFPDSRNCEICKGFKFSSEFGEKSCPQCVTDEEKIQTIESFDENDEDNMDEIEKVCIQFCF